MIFSGCVQLIARQVFKYVMHQSIPAVPIPLPGNRGAFADVVSAGDGAFAILSRLGGWALAYPGATPWRLTRVFERWMSLLQRTRPLSKTGLRRALRSVYFFLRERKKECSCSKSGKLFPRAETTELRN